MLRDSSHKQRVRLLVAYDGTPFQGWQKQPSGKPTVQGKLEKALSQIFDEPIILQGSGRTDSGVHAIGQTAHFDTFKDPRQYSLLYSLESMTPKEITIRKTQLAPSTFHARGSAINKIYKYFILTRPVPSPFHHNHMFWSRQPLNIDFLNQASQFLIGRMDFKCFQSAGTSVVTTTRTIHTAHWKILPENSILEFTISGSGFLKQMVRSIIGTLLDMYFQGLDPEHMKKVILSQDRRMAGRTAHPHGLYLYRVNYPKILDNKCLQF